VKIRAVSLAIFVAAISACGSSGPSSLTLVTYSSFPAEGTPLNEAIDAFEEQSGVSVEILVAGDTGTMVTKAVLTAGDPEGDVMWGIDSTMLGRAVDAEVFDPYRPAGLDAVRTGLVESVPDDLVTPVDFGDVCVNADREWFDNQGLAIPDSLDDLADPVYAGLLAVQDPSASSPGLAFLLATITRFADSWEDYWATLVANDVLITSDWDSAYYGAFTRAGGDRPLVVSYGSSPPYEVLFGDDPDALSAPTSVIADTCYRQIEYAGVLRGTSMLDEARLLVDFLISEDFQQHVPLDLYVFPAIDIALDPVFVRHAVIPENPAAMDPAAIDANRADWIERWTSVIG
jgi:thiamine transport system substrate-binding protein